MSSITRENVLAMSWIELANVIKNPATQAEMVRLIKTDIDVNKYVSQKLVERGNQTAATEAAVDNQLARVNPPSTEALAAEASTMASEPLTPVEPVTALPTEPVTPPAPAAPVSPVAPVADFSAEDAAWKLEGVTVTRDASGKVVRLVEEYQVRDEDGNSIGRPTHLEAPSFQELHKKERACHENATRAFHRLKKQKMTFKPEVRTILNPEQIAAAADAALQEKDSAKAQEMVRSIVETSYAERERKIREQKDYEDGRAISNEFMRRHLSDYNPCEANQKLIGEYFAENRLEFTLDNLEAAFLDLSDQGKLVKVPTFQRSVEVTPNPQPTTTTDPAPVTELPSAAQPVVVTPEPAQPQAASSQPVVEATVATPATPIIPAPVARRPGVNGGIPPGTMSANRPGPVDPANARKEFMKMVKNMSAEEMRRKRTDPQFVKQATAYGIQF